MSRKKNINITKDKIIRLLKVHRQTNKNANHADDSVEPNTCIIESRAQKSKRKGRHADYVWTKSIFAQR